MSLFGGLVCWPKNWMVAAADSGPLVLSNGCWVHDGLQMLSALLDAPTLPARCGCQAAAEHRINIAHLVLHTTWHDEVELRKERYKGHKHRA